MKTLFTFFVVFLVSMLLLAQEKPPMYTEYEKIESKDSYKNPDTKTIEKKENGGVSENLYKQKKDWPDLKIGASPEDVYRQLLPGEIAFKSDRKELIATRDSLMKETVGYLMPGEIMITDTATYASGHIRKFWVAQCGNLSYPVRKNGKSIVELDMKHLTPFVVYVSKFQEKEGRIVETVTMIPDTVFQNDVIARLERIENLVLEMKKEDTFWNSAWPWIIGSAIVVGTTTYAIVSSREETTVVNNYSEWTPPVDPPIGKAFKRWQIGFSFSLY